MPWTNYHTHSDFCDGKGAPEDYVKSALENNVISFGFSGHCPVPYPNEWSMPAENLDRYLDNIRELKNQYKDKIDIYLGLEIDFLPGIDLYRNFDISALDYTIGSVHFISAEALKENETVDNGLEEMNECLLRDFNGSARKAVEAYYITLQNMIKHTDIDIIGHLDIIKRNNAGNRFFSEDDKWYRDLVIDTLEDAAKSGKIIELNNGGITRKKISTYYPSMWILEKCLEMKIPVTLNSDAHSPKHITTGFTEAAKDLLSLGFREIFVLDDGKWTTREFDEEGVRIK